MTTSPLAATFLKVAAPALFFGTVIGGDYSKAVIDDKMPHEAWGFCDIFDKAVIYKNEDFLPFQKFAFTGRLQADAVFFEANQGDYDSLEWRRFRSGFKSQHFDHFTVHAEVDLDLVNSDPLYTRLTDSYIGWSKDDSFELKVGKHGALFTMDGATSSKSLIRMERSLLSNNLWFPEEYFTGASANGEIGNWVYNAGVFSSDGGPEFGDFEAGYFSLLSIGYNFADALGLDKALVRADYVHNDPTGNGLLNTRNLANIGSFNATFEQGPWGLRTDFSVAEGLGTQSDLVGFAIMPYYDISDQWQLVGSYNYVSSDGTNGVRLDRYENRIEGRRSNEAHEFYFGINRYLCEHKLKWQTGLEYTTADDRANDGGSYDGWGLSSGIRISW
jgi:phosphate-selective porin OprO and OprP